MTGVAGSMVKTTRRIGLPRTTWWLGMLVVAAAAFGLRLVPVLVGGGLFGRGNYDDGVYFAAAVGLAHGLLPYRDFLLLHPPGILLALAPFAALARWIGEPDAFAAARIGFMIIGTVNAVLVAVVLRRLGMMAAVTGGLFYAVFYPAVYVEHTTLLEPLATTCLLGAVGLVAAAGPPTIRLRMRLVMAGVLLGLSASLKIWGIVPALVVAGWVLVVLGWRRAGLVLAGIVAGATAVCLPFFAAAPKQMWRMVVLAQLGRPEQAVSWATRTVGIAGLSLFGPAGRVWWWAAATALLVLCGLAAWRSAVGRLAVVILAATVAVLFAAPSWFVHYAAFSAGALALVVGAAAGRIADVLRRPAPRVIAAAAAVTVLGGYATAVVVYPFGQPFPTAQLAGPVAASRTCVTTDDPIVLIELQALQRNLDRDCLLVADLGGYNYAMQIGATPFRSRVANPRWQALALDYLRSGDTAVTGVRFPPGSGFSRKTVAQMRTWRLLDSAGEITARHPSSRHSPR